MDNTIENQGIIYVLTNEAMPNYIKIGKTKDLKKRLSSLNNTSVPEPFEVFYASLVNNVDFVERQIHLAFSDKRTAKNREFFSVSPDQVVAILKIIEIEPAENADSSYHQEIEDSKERNRRKPFNFGLVNMKAGDEISFTSDPTIKAYVSKDLKHIEYSGQTLSLSAAAAQIINPDYPLQGTVYWEYEGKTLDDIRRDIEDNNDNN